MRTAPEAGRPSALPLAALLASHYAPADTGRFAEFPFEAFGGLEAIPLPDVPFAAGVLADAPLDAAPFAAPLDAVALGEAESSVTLLTGVGDRGAFALVRIGNRLHPDRRLHLQPERLHGR